MSDIKKFDFEIINKKKINFSDIFSAFKENIYSLIFYVFGLIIGSYFYKITCNDNINKLLTTDAGSLYVEIIANLILYISVWLILILMGFSVIGFSFMNVIPFFAGIFYGLKTSCYFTIYGAKGIGYGALAIAPASSMFLVLILYTISYNSKLSKSIFEVIRNKERSFTLSIKPLVVQVIIQLVLFFILSFINSMLSTGMRNIISI